MAEWIIPPGHRVPLPLARPWAVPAGRWVPLPFGPDGEGPEPPDPTPIRYVALSAGLPWDLPPVRLRVVASGWRTAAAHQAHHALPWQQQPAVAVATGWHWGDIPRIQARARLPWGAQPVQAAAVDLLSGLPPDAQAAVQVPWGLPSMRPHSAGVPWRAPPAQRISAGIPWGLPALLVHAAAWPWTAPPPQEVRHWAPWQGAPHLRWQVPGPGVEPPAPVDPPSYVPPPGHRVPLSFACPWPAPPANRVRLPFGAAQCYAAWRRPRRYLVLNSASVVRLPDRTPIAVESGSVQAQLDDAHRAFRLDLADPSQLAWLQPGPDGEPRSVEINLNGWIWTGIIEGWTRNRRHIKDGGPGMTVTVSGRSRSALLDTPHAPARSIAVAEERTAQQLIDAELQFTGFTAQVPMGWSWLVPGGVFSYDALTPIAAIRRVAAAAGAVAIAHPWDDVIIIRPRYSRRAGDEVSPWHWASTAPDVQVHDSLILEDGRNGGAGAAAAASFTLPLWPSSTPDRPGLIEPGDLVEVVEPGGSKALAAGITISFGMQRSGNGAAVLVIEQTVALDPAPAAPLYDTVLVSGQHAGVSDPVRRDGTAGTTPLPTIIDPLITTHAVARERGRNALAGAATGTILANIGRILASAIRPAGRLIKGNINGAQASDGSYAVTTADGGTIRARPLPGQTWASTTGVYVRDGIIIDEAPSLPSVEQVV